MSRHLSFFGPRISIRPDFRTLIVLLAIAGVFQSLPMTHAEDAPFAEAVLNRLRTVDTLYASALTARGTELEQSPNFALAFGGAAPPVPGKRERKSTLLFTVSDDREASIEDYLTQFPGAGVPGPNGVSEAPLHKTVFIMSGDSSTTRRFNSPKWPEDHQSTTEHHLLSRPRNTWFECRVLWSLGRGYSPFLDEIHSVTVANGLIQLEATGVLVNPTDRGSWSLTIDPKLNDAVTRARYTEGRGPKFEMDASDFVSKDNCVYPNRSKTNYGSMLRHEHEYTDVKLVFDEDLFDEAVALATEEPTARSVVHDSRLASHTVAFAGGTTFSAGRPTSELVAPAVQASRDRFNERFDPQTFLAAAPARLDDLRIRIDQAEKIPNDKERQTVATALKFERLLLTSRVLAAEARRAKPRSITPEVEDEKPLMPFDWIQTYVGTLGFIGPQAQGNESSGAIRCLQRIDEKRFVGRYESSTAAPAGKRNFTSRPFLFVGIQRDENGEPIKPGGFYRVKFNGIVTGDFTWAEAGKPDRNIEVVERFEPDAPFQ